MAWWQSNESDEGGFDLVASKRDWTRQYASINRDRDRGGFVASVLGSHQEVVFDTEADAELWVRAKLKQIVADLAEIPELYESER